MASLSRLTQTRPHPVAGVTGRLADDSAAPGSVKVVPVRTCHGTDHVADGVPAVDAAGNPLNKHLRVNG